MENKQWNGEEILAKLKGFIRRFGKRNLAIVLSVLLIGGAVWMNFTLFRGAGEKGVMYYQGEAEKAASGEDGGNSVDADKPAADNYFAATQVNRQRSRDQAIEVLNLIATNEEALTDSVRSALAQIEKIASDIEKEANIETMVKAKGFRECVAVISEDHCSVILSSDGLLPNEAAQIQEIVYEQAGILPANVKLVEKAG